jgi:hypothetical protein
MAKQNNTVTGKTSRKTLVAGSVFASIFLGVSAFSYYELPSLTSLSYNSAAVKVAATSSAPQKPKEPPVIHLPTPKPLKAIYMSQCVVGTPNFRKDLVKLIDETELNAVIIDIKDYTGKISFPSNNPLLKDTVSDACGAIDMELFIKTLHDKNIYVIGRITVFQSPHHTKTHPEWAVKKVSNPNEVWKDYKGLSFVDVSAKPYWEYVIELSKESYAIGFDELNYDYIRYPSDGPMSEVNPTWSAGKNRQAALEEFFKYLHDTMKPTGVVMSADLFGMTTTNFDDLNIGQVLERALPYFDYIAPMVYPSHYPKSFLGLGDPNKDPYRVVNYSMSEAVKRTIATTTIVQGFAHVLLSTTTKPYLYSKPAYDKQKLRPWLQDFDYGGNYDIAEVKAQIRATYDAGLTSWMLWAPSNRYTRGALEPQQ